MSEHEIQIKVHVITSALPELQIFMHEQVKRMAGRIERRGNKTAKSWQVGAPGSEKSRITNWPYESPI